MVPQNLCIRRITDIQEDDFWNFLNLIVKAFPKNEQMLPGFFRNVLVKSEADGEETCDMRILALHQGEDPEGPFLGIGMYQLLREEKILYLWYLAIEPEFQNQGLGTWMYREILQRALAEIPDLRGVTFELERPDQAQDDTGRIEAERRITFYRRLGVQIASNIEYLQSVGSWQPVTLMYLCLQPLQQLSDSTVLKLLRYVYGDDMKPAKKIVWQ